LQRKFVNAFVRRLSKKFVNMSSKRSQQRATEYGTRGYTYHHFLHWVPGTRYHTPNA